MDNTWLSILPATITIAVAIWSKKVLPSLLLGLLVGSYLLDHSVIGGLETAIANAVNTISDKGSGWAASALIMPFAISLAVSGGSGIPICVAAVITGGTFGDVTSPVAEMTNMSSNAADADQVKYLKYANPYNFTALVLAALLFLIFGIIGGQSFK